METSLIDLFFSGHKPSRLHGETTSGAHIQGKMNPTLNKPDRSFSWYQQALAMMQCPVEQWSSTAGFHTQ